MTKLKYITTSLLLFLAPIKGLVITVLACVLIDTFLGIYCTVKLNGWSSFKSSKFFNLAVKVFFYLSTIMLAFLIDKYIAEGVLFGVNNLVSKSTTVLWVLIELKSIDENSVKLGNKPILEIIQGIVNKMKTFKKDFNEIK